MIDLQPVLDAYQIKPTKVEKVTDRVFKIHTNYRIYALKHTSLSDQQLGHWQAVHHFLDQRKVLGFLPVFFTVAGDPFVTNQQSIFYLMPWVESFPHERPTDEWTSFFHALGKLHASTLQLIELDQQKQNQAEYQAYFHSEMKRNSDELLQYIRLFEAKRFMSPVELQACMYYRDMEWVLEETEKWQQVYLDALEKSDKTSIVLCHGNLDPTHYIMTNNQTYFLNWEHAQMASPVHDLISFLLFNFQYHDCQINKLKEGLRIYFQYIPFGDLEKSQLALQLLSMEKYMHCLKAHNTPNKQTVIYESIRFEKEYRKLLFSIQLSEDLFSTIQQVEMD
ncbi:phosphotransferase [Gracilibacillus dipsosauri]|uniref:phosphotransferase n=1 Tax=Gracilibacillus dipsosauri TaxID=178340 RepID=UPI002409F2B1